ncbi:hypothetical protein WL08_12535 [Burkholderia ubonensis]|nr:hypothetical protein WL08_12535 [Burkholderia ubonensis]
MSLSWVCVTTERSMPLGRNWRSKPLVFSLLPLPRRMQVGKPDIEIQALGEFDMAGHFRSAVVGQALAQKGRQLLHLAREAFQGVLCGAAVHAAQHDEACLALDQRAHTGTIEGAFDEVALPMPRPLPQLDLLRSMHDAQFLGHKAGTGKRRASTSTRGLFLAQGFNHRLLQFATRVGINGGVNRFVADSLFGIVGMHTTKSGSNLLRRPAPVDQPVMHMLIQRMADTQLALTHTTLATNTVRRRGLRRIVVQRACIAVAHQFTRNCRRTSPEQSRDGSHATAFSMFDHDDRALLCAQMLVLLHRNTLPQSGCCT